MGTHKIYFDVNVVLDIIDSTRKYSEQANKLWNLAVINNYEIVISEDMLSTIYYINKDKEYTLEFFKLISMRWSIVSFGKEVIEKAITLSLEKNIDLEDTLQCLCAKEQACDLFVTSDKKFHDCGINVVTYSHFKI